MSSTVTSGDARAQYEWMVSEPVSGLRAFGVPGDSGRRVFQPKDPLLVGKGSECDVVFDFPTISKIHAIIRREGRGLEIEDQRSKNYVVIDGAMVQRGPLVPGSRIE